MGRILYVVACLFCLMTQWYAVATTPDSVKGLWKNATRLLCFTDADPSTQESGSLTTTKTSGLSMASCLYYGWYYDTVASQGESTKNSEGNGEQRKPNAATSRTVRSLHTTFQQIENGTGTGNYLNAYELTIDDAGEQSVYPVAVIDNGLYTDFFIKQENGEDAFYQTVNSSDNIRINGRVNQQNIYCYYVHKGVVYKIRYWAVKSDSFVANGQQNSDVSFRVGKGKDTRAFVIPRFIVSCSVYYTCVVGRRKVARNIEIVDPASYKNILQKNAHTSGNILAIGQPSFTKVQGSANDAAQFKEIIAHQNSMRKKDQPPLFKDDDFPPNYDGIMDKDIEELHKEIDKTLPR